MTTPTERVYQALQEFADSVARKVGAPAPGEPEDQLRAPFERLIVDGGRAVGSEVVAQGESRLPDRLGKPDFAVSVGGLLAGYVELKAPGKGARVGSFKGHDKRQWERFRSLPNVLYTDGNEWGLYRTGERVGRVVRLDGDVTADGSRAVAERNASAIERLVRDFLSWEPLVPRSARQLAELLAPLCRGLRDDVLESLPNPGSPLVALAGTWRNLLFPGASDEQFADAYAQTVTYALLLSRADGASTLNVRDAVDALRSEYGLLSKALEALTDPQAQGEIGTSLRILQRVVDRIDPHALHDGQTDPWLYFYEDFLGAYDPDLRRDAGVYYTPREVVQAQVRLIDALLTNHFGLAHGFADLDVETLDPGVGTGTYLLGVIDQSLGRIESEEGPGSVPGRASHLGQHIKGFEIMVGPYAVAELRVAQALQRRGGRPPTDGPVYLTDTLESPTAKPVAPPLFYKPLAEEHRRALMVKESQRVLVCLGNPPYDRHAADDPGKGGWVRNGAEGERPILEDFLEPARKAGHGVHLKNLYNLYVYFWRWALWKVFEHKTAAGPGIVSFITAASYLRGPGFVGMREHLRRVCDEIWIIDLGGEGRGTRQSENVFAIKTPVAIAIAVRYGDPDPATPAKVHFARVKGSREEKLARLDRLQSVHDLMWKESPTGWQDPFGRMATGDFFSWPALVDVFPWQHSGVQMKRTWPIAPDPSTLERRWAALLNAPDRAEAFRETRDRKVERSYLPLTGDGRAVPVADLPEDAPTPPIVRYAFRSFDRQYVISDGRLGDFMRPVLWNTHGDGQVYLTTLLSHPLGHGPAVSACGQVPDLHHFRGSYGGKDIIPLWRDAENSQPNLHPNVQEVLRSALGITVSPEDILAFVYALLAQPAYTERFFEELGMPVDEGMSPGPRIPVTRDTGLFQRGVELGRRLLELHTYGASTGSADSVPGGAARCVVSIPEEPDGYPESFEWDEESQQLAVGAGRFAPVSQEVWDYEVSGLHVVASWLGYRLKEPAGRRSSPLDNINPKRWPPAYTSELLELLWVLEGTVALQSQQEALLEEVLGGPMVAAEDLSPIPDALRAEPSWSRGQHELEL